MSTRAGKTNNKKTHGKQKWKKAPQARTERAALRAAKKSAEQKSNQPEALSPAKTTMDPKALTPPSAESAVRTKDDFKKSSSLRGSWSDVVRGRWADKADAESDADSDAESDCEDNKGIARRPSKFNQKYARSSQYYKRCDSADHEQLDKSEVPCEEEANDCPQSSDPDQQVSPSLTESSKQRSPTNDDDDDKSELSGEEEANYCPKYSDPDQQVPPSITANDDDDIRMVLHNGRPIIPDDKNNTFSLPPPGVINKNNHASSSRTTSDRASLIVQTFQPCALMQSLDVNQRDTPYSQDDSMWNPKKLGSTISQILANFWIMCTAGRFKNLVNVLPSAVLKNKELLLYDKDVECILRYLGVSLNSENRCASNIHHLLTNLHFLHQPKKSLIRSVAVR